MHEIYIKDLMSEEYLRTTAEASLLEITHTMREQRCSCMVITENDRPIGIVTERDLVGVLGDVLEHHKTDNINVTEFMTSPPITVKETDSLFDALVLTQMRKIRHLPVVDDDGTLQGILTYSDIAHAHFKVTEQQREFIEEAVADKTRDLREANEQLKALSLEDGLLGIGNRRSMEVDLNYTHSMAIRYERPYSIVLFDVDCFKKYNDHYGHAAGDEALKQVANHISGSIRKADRLYRYGGEELLLILPETEAKGAEIIASRITNNLAELEIPHEKSPHKVLTMSGGIGCLDISNDNHKDAWQPIIEQADEGLYKAKDIGRNQVNFILAKQEAVRVQAC